MVATLGNEGRKEKNTFFPLSTLCLVNRASWRPAGWEPPLLSLLSLVWIPDCTTSCTGPWDGGLQPKSCYTQIVLGKKQRVLEIASCIMHFHGHGIVSSSSGGWWHRKTCFGLLQGPAGWVAAGIHHCLGGLCPAVLAGRWTGLRV